MVTRLVVARETHTQPSLVSIITAHTPPLTKAGSHKTHYLSLPAEHPPRIRVGGGWRGGKRLNHTHTHRHTHTQRHTHTHFSFPYIFTNTLTANNTTVQPPTPHKTFTQYTQPLQIHIHTAMYTSKSKILVIYTRNDLLVIKRERERERERERYYF